MLDPGLETFLEGVLGSGLMEVVTIYEYYNQERELPPRYKKAGFWTVRAMIAISGGLLAYFQGIRNAPLLAINVGASTPLLLRALGSGVIKRD
jgi:hypothetical protein